MGPSVTGMIRSKAILLDSVRLRAMRNIAVTASQLGGVATANLADAGPNHGPGAASSIYRPPSSGRPRKPMRWLSGSDIN